MFEQLPVLMCPQGERLFDISGAAGAVNPVSISINPSDLTDVK